MKPKNKVQAEVERKSRLLPLLSSYQAKKAIKHLPFAKRGETCFNAIEFSVYTTIGGWQVCRNFLIERRRKLDKGIDYSTFELEYKSDNWYTVSFNDRIEYDFYEQCQVWIHPNQKEIVVRATGSPFMMNGAYELAKWSYLEVRDIFRKSGYYHVDNRWKYLYNSKYHLIVKILPEFKKDVRDSDITTFYHDKMMEFSEDYDLKCKLITEKRLKEHERKMKNYPTYEFLCRYEQKSLLCEYMHLDKPQDFDKFLVPIKIANRHHFIVKDAPLWLDSMKMMIEMGKDIHNPKYVCDPNIIKAHSMWHDMMIKHKKKMEAIKKKEEALLQEKGYANKIRNVKDLYLDVPGKDCHIIMCQTVLDMLEEGDAMHHCVYNMRHYLKNTLILFARTSQNARVATIELDAINKRIIQVRGLQNRTPLYNDEIQKTLHDNMDYIHDMLTGKLNQSKLTVAV